MKTLKYTQILSACPSTLLLILFIAGWLLLIIALNPATAQTNDPKLSQQYYLFDHKIDQAWTYTKGSSNTRIAIHSIGGFTASHEDLEGARYLNPWTEWFGPQHDYASEIAGIIGAQTNNGIGIAGIDWNATMKSYNILRKKQSGDNNGAATFTYNGQDYYLDTGKLSVMVDQAIQDEMDIHVFTFGVPSAKETDLKLLESVNRDLYLKTTVVPSFPTPDPQKAFWNAVRDMGASLGENLWNTIKGNNYTPPSDLELLRQKLWEVTQPSNKGINIAPVGDVQNQQQLEILMPAVMENYVLTIAGAEKDAGGQYIQWSNSQSAPFIDITATAKDIVSTSGTAYSAYNNNFSSTAAATGIAAGVVSLLKAENPNLTHDDVEQILKLTAFDIEDPGHDDKTGYGFIDAEAALAFVRNNNINHKQSSGSSISITNNVETNPSTITMSSHYLSFTEKNAVTAYGKLRKITGKISFEQPFTNTPEGWLRMTSSGIDNRIIPINRHYYDSYDKAFKITSITTTDLTFELYFWLVEYYNSVGQKVETRNIPDINQLSIDYTVVGEETNWPLTASIDGLTLFNPGSQGFWNASVSGGEPPYSYNWQRSYGGTSGPWTQVGTSSSYSQTVTHEMWLKLFVTDSSCPPGFPCMGVEDTKHIRVTDCYEEPGQPPCPEPKIVAPEEQPQVYALGSNYPNPFNPSTNLRFDLPEQAEVRLEIYNILGQRVATLLNETRPAGSYTVPFNAGRLSSGMYIARLVARGASGERFTKEITMQLIK